MEKIKRFIDCYISTETCNFRCSYCYITQQRKFNNEILKFDYTPEYIRKALSLERLGGKCLINLCAGGETLLSEDIIKITKALLEEGHYIMIVTNGSLTKRFNQIFEFDKELLERLFFKFSFHYKQLIDKNMVDIYFNNIKKAKEKGCSFTVELTPNDELINEIENIKKMCNEKLGTLCHITIARNDKTPKIDVLSEYSLDEYYNIWKNFDSELLNFKYSIFGNKINKFCYAGDWSIYLNLLTGDIKQCYCGKIIDNVYENLERPINFEAIGYGCELPHCYNGHAFLTLGVIPELQTPSYADLRNRKSIDGEEWLNEKMKSFMNQKLKDNNTEYTDEQKKNNLRNVKRKRLCKVPINIARNIKRGIFK